MSTYISAWISPNDDAPKPYCRINGGGNAVIHLDQASINLGDIADPATYLRDLAHKLLALAADVDAARDTRAPTGYDAPIGLVPTEKAARS